MCYGAKILKWSLLSWGASGIAGEAWFLLWNPVGIPCEDKIRLAGNWCYIAHCVIFPLSLKQKKNPVEMVVFLFRKLFWHTLKPEPFLKLTTLLTCYGSFFIDWFHWNNQSANRNKYLGCRHQQEQIRKHLFCQWLYKISI